MSIEIFVHFHHIENRSFKYMERSFIDELVVLLAHSAGKLHQSHRGNIASDLDAEFAISKREHERECAEVVALRKVGTHSTRHSPVGARTMRDRLFVREEVSVAFHRNAETLCQNVIACRWCFLCSFYIQVIRVVGYGYAEVRVCLEPH